MNAGAAGLLSFTRWRPPIPAAPPVTHFFAQKTSLVQQSQQQAALSVEWYCALHPARYSALERQEPRDNAGKIGVCYWIRVYPNFSCLNRLTSCVASRFPAVSSQISLTPLPLLFRAWLAAHPTMSHTPSPPFSRGALHRPPAPCPPGSYSPEPASSLRAGEAEENETEGEARKKKPPTGWIPLKLPLSFCISPALLDDECRDRHSTGRGNYLPGGAADARCQACGIP
ncbi:hypothetical protein GQ53DRAFT_366630 [Thozetella sp. PMI_491]|nr:hypothetical protein GQ53DRAFT_366630 [Thozetella sp. PMI_491]